MECPNCGAELNHVSEYGYLALHQSGMVLGNIYQCPNHEGFGDADERNRYISENSDDGCGEDIYCSSCAHNGFFYTNQNGDLNTGYPC